ncbi:unnamed protein product [Citrullus colocynthis]|uniref:Uncharacterized protein n=1 Tax=Citrullus colocynthis TaxID=252529 RepID=A0ABP0Y7H7_9ROSI
MNEVLLGFVHFSVYIKMFSFPRLERRRQQPSNTAEISMPLFNPLLLFLPPPTGMPAPPSLCSLSLRWRSGNIMMMEMIKQKKKKKIQYLPGMWR